MRLSSSGIFLVSFVVIAMQGCGLFSSSPSSGPPPALSIVQANDLGPIPTNVDILGRDGGYSALFQGYSVWLYGDTFLAKPNYEDRTLLSDTWSFTTDLNAQDGITGFQERLDSVGAPTMILPETPAEQAFNQAHNGTNCQTPPCGDRWALWPSAIVVNPADNTALIFYMVVSARPGNFNFQGIGTSVATWRNIQQQPQRPTLNPPIVSDHPDLLFAQNEPGFGSAAFISNGMLYAYGCGYNSGCELGKVAPANAQVRSAWSFYAGSGNWSTQIDDAVTVFNDANILSISWNAFLQCYVALYSPPFSQNVVMRTSANPEGPWSNETVAFVAKQPAPGNGNVYDALGHAEYDANGGQTIYVSYSRATPAPFSSEVRLVAVTLRTASSQPLSNAPLLALTALVSPPRAQAKPEDPKIVFDLEKPAAHDNSSPFVPNLFGKTCTPFDLKSGPHVDHRPWNKSASILELAGAPIEVIKIRRYGPTWKNPDDVRNLITKLLKTQTMEFSRYQPWAEMVFADIVATVQYSDHTEGVLEVSNVHVCFSDDSRHTLWLRVFPPK